MLKGYLEKGIKFFKADLVFTISLLLALGSMLIVPPNPDYLGYLDYSVLATLFCLMCVVAGFRKSGLLSWISRHVLRLARHARSVSLLFVLLSGVVFFGWGEIFSLFPSTLTDTFGSEHAASNYGWLYISQGIGSIFGGPLAALLYQYTHGWHVVFSCAIGLDFVTAALALWVLKPWRARFIRQHS